MQYVSQVTQMHSVFVLTFITQQPGKHVPGGADINYTLDVTFVRIKSVVCLL